MNYQSYGKTFTSLYTTMKKKPYFVWGTYEPTYDTFLRYANNNKHKLTGIAVLSECFDIPHFNT